MTGKSRFDPASNVWVPKMSSDLLTRTMHIETCRFPPPYDRCSSGTTKSGIVRLRR